MKTSGKALLRLTLLITAFALLAACTYSYSSEPGGHILYIPLDDRPVNYANAVELVGISGLQVKYPPVEQLKNEQELWGWIKTNSGGAAAAVISVDMLAYGGLVESRKHQLDLDELHARLNVIKELEISGPVLAFVSIMRTPAANTQHTMPGYYSVYGAHIYKYGMLRDKINSGVGEPGDKEHLDRLIETIPGEYIEDFTARRDKNHRVTSEVLQLARQGFIDYLVVSSDDTSPYGFSRVEKQQLVDLAQRYGAADKVAFFPGTDECGMLLLAAAVNKLNSRNPTVFVDYAEPPGAGTVQLYEDIPLDENVRRHILAAGAAPANSAAEADLVLAVNNKGSEADEAAKPGASTHSDFVQRIKQYIDAGKPVTIADAKYPNGADPDFMRELNKAVYLPSLAGYSGWNTAGNSTGIALSQGLMYGPLVSSGLSGPDEKHRLVLLTRLVEDWGYQAEVRPEIKESVPPGQQQLFTDRELESEVTGTIEEGLNTFAGAHLADFGAVKVTGVKLPWHRLFDIELTVETGR